MSAKRRRGAANHAMCHPDSVWIPRSHSACVSDGASRTRQSSDRSTCLPRILTLFRIASVTARSDMPSISSSMFIVRSVAVCRLVTSIHLICSGARTDYVAAPGAGMFRIEQLTRRTYRLSARGARNRNRPSSDRVPCGGPDRARALNAPLLKVSVSVTAGGPTRATYGNRQATDG